MSTKAQGKPQLPGLESYCLIKTYLMLARSSRELGHYRNPLSFLYESSLSLLAPYFLPTALASAAQAGIAREAVLNQSRCHSTSSIT